MYDINAMSRYLYETHRREKASFKVFSGPPVIMIALLSLPVLSVRYLQGNSSQALYVQSLVLIQAFTGMYIVHRT